MWSAVIDDLVGAAATTFFALLLAWLFGNQLTAKWNLWQKRRETSLAAVTEFTRLYGSFFSIWKLWNYVFENGADTDTRWELLKKATAAEADIEALMVLLSSQTKLTPRDVEIAGKFRQGYQQLRQHIRDNRKIDWQSAKDPKYLALKRLAAPFAQLVATMDQGAFLPNWTQSTPSPGSLTITGQQIGLNR